VDTLSARITDRDLDVLAFLAEHRLVMADHVRSLLGVSASVARRRLHALSELGLVSQRRLFHGQPSSYQITRHGLGAIHSALPPPRLDWRSYAHDAGVAWIWLAAQRGAFGELREVVSERRMRSHDASARRRDEVLGVRLGGTGPAGGPRVHHPDLLLIDRQGRRIAVELELSSKGRDRRDRILRGYAADPRIDAVLYLVEDRRVGRSVQDSARRLGIAPLVHVQPVRWAAGRPPDAAGHVRRRATTPKRARAAAPEASR
jgi:hypothetical protein